MHQKILPWLLFLTLAAFVSSPSTQGQTPTPMPPGLIKVAKASGSVSAKDAGGKTIVLKVGDEIYEHSVVTTAKDSSVILVFSNGATINLGQDSSLSIDEFLQDPFSNTMAVSKMTKEPSHSKTKLFLSRGELVGNVKKLDHEGGSSFEVNTPVGAAGIRGTTFRIVFRPSGTGQAFFQLTTVEGNVVLASGTVALPNEISVPDNKEVEVVVDVTVDESTGTITVTAPATTTPPVVVDTPPATQAAVTAQAQQVAEAAATVTFTSSTTATVAPPSTDTSSSNSNNSGDSSSSGDSNSSSSSSSGDSNTSGGTTGTTNPPANTTPPPATTTPPRTTSGDGQ